MRARHTILTCSALLAALAIVPAASAVPSTSAPPAARVTFGTPFGAGLAAPAPIVRGPVAHDVSPPLRELAAKVYPPAGETRPFSLPFRSVVPPAAAAAAARSSAPDSVRQSLAPAAMPAPIQTFEGNSQADNVVELGGFIVNPPDSTGEASDLEYVQWVNYVFGVFNKTTGARLLRLRSDRVFANFANNPCGTSFPVGVQTDPIVLFDQLASRWFVSILAFNTDPVSGEIDLAQGFYQCIGVSTTSSALGPFNRYAYKLSNKLLNDYPHFGVWPDAYYLSINQFDLSQPTEPFVGPGALAFDRAGMIAGAAAPLMVYFDTIGPNPNFPPMLPSDVDGPAPPLPGAPNPFVMGPQDDSFGFPADSIGIWHFHVDFGTPANSTFTHVANLTTAPYDSNLCNYDRACIPQPATTNKLDAISDRVLNRAAYRRFATHEAIVVNHTVNVGADQAGVRWYEIRGGTTVPSIFQQGTFAPDADHRWMGSAAMDHNGDLAVGYSVSSTTTRPSIRYAGRLAGDALGQLAQGEATLAAGVGSQTRPSDDTSDFYNRWGDYTHLAIDPTDDCTFWYTNEYYPSGTVFIGEWHTRIGSFKFPGCSVPTAASVTRFTTHRTSRGITVSWRTTSETNALGFNVWRSTGATGSWRKLNRGLLPARRSGTTRGGAYRHVDRSARPGRLYTYRLQVVDLRGKPSWYGIGSATG